MSRAQPRARAGDRPRCRARTRTSPPASSISGRAASASKTSGSYTSLDQVRDTVIASVDGRIVRVRDVAEVSWNTAAYSYTGRFKGKRAVFVTANQKDGYNILEVRERVDRGRRQLRGASLPKRMKLEVGFDQSRERAPPAQPAVRRFRHRDRAGAAHAAAARLARRRHRDGLDPAVAGVRPRRACTSSATR